VKRFIKNLTGNRWTRTVMVLAIATFVGNAAWVQSQNRKPRIATRDNEYRKFLNSSESGFQTNNSILDSSDHLLDLDTSRIDKRVVRQLMTRFADDAVLLADEMDRAYSTTPELRPFLSDAAKLQFRVDSLARQVERGYELRRVASDFRSIDRDWRNLAHGLDQIHAENRNMTVIIKRINTHDKELGDIFKIRPQLDRDQLIAYAATLRTDLLNLVDDIEMEFGNSAKSYEYILQTRSLSEDMQHLQDIIKDGYTFDEIISDYKRFRRQWGEFVVASEQLDNRYVSRGIRRVAITDNQIRKLLWMPVQTNRAELTQMAETLLRDLDEFMSRTPLKLIIRLDDPELALSSSDEFNEYCKELRQCILRGDSEAELRYCFADVQRTSAVFLQAFQPLMSQAGQSVLREIENELNTLGVAFNYSHGSDVSSQREFVDLVTKLENLAQHSEFDVHAWLKESRPNFASEAMQATTRFADDCHALNQAVIRSEVPAADLQARVADLNAQFANVYYKYLRNADDKHRDHIVLTSARVHETLFDLKKLVEL
jgi:hypothetical protein